MSPIRVGVRTRRMFSVRCLAGVPHDAPPGRAKRARSLSEGLRCLVCQNESIDESNASLARDLRLLVRERLVEGDSDEQVIDFLVERYGEFVLLRPTARGANLLLWLAAPAMFLLALGVGWATIRARSRSAVSEDLSDEEQKRLDEILRS